MFTVIMIIIIIILIIILITIMVFNAHKIKVHILVVTDYELIIHHRNKQGAHVTHVVSSGALHNS